MSDLPIPKIIKDVGFDFWWQNKKVWNLDYPAEDMDISELEWHFEIPFWNTKSGRYDLKPIDVIVHPSEYAEEYTRTIKTDMTYPIDIMWNKGRWLILDGLHRLVKAEIQNMKKVRVRKIPTEDIPNIQKD